MKSSNEPMNKIEDEETIYIDPNWTLKRIYDYKPYTFHRIKRILEQDFGYRLENIYQGYKANRSPFYQELYRLVQIHDNQVIVERVSLNQLRRFLAQRDYPLYDEKSVHTERNSKAEAFLNIVDQLNNQAK